MTLGRKNKIDEAIGFYNSIVNMKINLPEHSALSAIRYETLVNRCDQLSAQSARFKSQRIYEALNELKTKIDNLKPIRP
jgi:hypothetical protein